LADSVRSVTVQDMLKEKDSLMYDVGMHKTVFHAIKTMSKHNVGCLIVKEHNPKMAVGLFTERDYREKLILKDRSSKETTVGEVYTSSVVCVTPSFTLDECAQYMVSHDMRHLPVVTNLPEDSLDGDMRVIGVISSRDIVTYLIRALERISENQLDFTVGDAFDTISRKHTSDFFLTADRTVFEALQMMSKHDISSVVVHESTKITGIFTERDYLHKVALQNRNSKQTTLGEIMTKNVISVPDNTPISKGLKILLQHNIRSLPIFDLAGDELDYSNITTIGLISEMDIIEFVMKEAAHE